MEKIIKMCRGCNINGEKILPSPGVTVEINRNGIFYEPTNCQYLTGKRKDMCSASSPDPEKWGYCKYVQAV